MALGFASLVVACCLLAACSTDGDNAQHRDAGHDHHSDADASADADAQVDAAVALELTLGKRVDGQFEPLGSAESFEVVAGFQGGFHIEPAIHLEAPDAETFITVVDYTVTDVGTDEIISEEPGTYRIDGRGWEPHPEGGLVRLFERVILDVPEASEADGRRVRLDVEVEVEEGLGRGADSVVVDLVDEFDERTGLRGP